MNRRLRLSAASEPGLLLRTVESGDMEALRVWKNTNKAGFFFKGDITPAMQTEWFKSYKKRADDFMFAVEHNGAKAGCMGFRILDDATADTYNIIAAPGANGKGVMRAAMIVMCSYIAANFTREIRCRVLKGNEALKYYEKCGYRIVDSTDDYDILRVEWSLMKQIPVQDMEPNK